MPHENVEVVRRIFEGWARGDLRAGVERFDPHVLLVLRPEFPEAGTYCGLDEIRGYTTQLLSAWGEFAMAGEEFIEAGDSIVVCVRQHGTGAESAVPVEHRYYQVWTFRGESVIRIESVWDRAEALEAVGLRE